jgi:hypothetical protein
MLTKIINYLHFLNRLPDEWDNLKGNQGIIYFDGIRKVDKFDEAGFCVFSQFDEDGLLDFIIKNVKLDNKTFIEFGIGDFSESNCRFLLQFRGWSGFVVEGSRKATNRLSARSFSWKFNLKIENKFLDLNSIKNTLNKSGFKKKLGILSVDVDGVDWFLLQEVIDLNPQILIVEYNSLFGSDTYVTVPYNHAFNRWEESESGVFYGASLGAFDELLSKHGYILVGTNSGGNNAFFVRLDSIKNKNNLFKRSIKEVYKQRSFGETRLKNKKLSKNRSIPIEILEKKILEIKSEKVVKLKSVLEKSK